MIGALNNNNQLLEQGSLWLALLSSAVAACWGIHSLRHGVRSRLTIYLMALAFVAQFIFLIMRGEQRQACPLRDMGEVITYVAWSLTMFYLLIGPTYRISLLGVFTAPLVALSHASSLLLPGMLSVSVEPVMKTTAWGETHAATAVLAYGAFALAAVAGIMFLVLDKQLKKHDLKSSLFRNLPPVRNLLDCMRKLLWVGIVLLTLGIIAGFFMEHQSGWAHWIAAVLVWCSYVGLMLMQVWRGMSGRRFTLAVVILFLVSLMVFASL
jgi:ABC-type uncharacterized transport system permease subunit